MNENELKKLYERMLQLEAENERLRTEKATNEGKRLIVDTSSAAAAAKSYLSNTKDKGRKGRAAEVLVREYIKGTIEKVHPLGVADTSGKCGSIEIKTGCGWIVSPVFNSKEEVMTYYEKTRLPMKARYVIYMPEFFGSIAGARVFTQRQFLNILEDCQLIVFKKSTQGAWGTAIQSFKNSKKKSGLFYDQLESGLTLDQFIATHII